MHIAEAYCKVFSATGLVNRSCIAFRTRPTHFYPFDSLFNLIMGQSASYPSSLPHTALHCLRVNDGSPAAGQIEPFFDYLVGVDDAYDLDPKALGQMAAQGKVIKVYNAKSQRIRGERGDWS